MKVTASVSSNAPSNVAQQTDIKFGDNTTGGKGLPNWVPVAFIFGALAGGIYWIMRRSKKT